MKRIVILILLCVFVLTVSKSYAHPPSDIKVEFNASTRILVLIIAHSVSNPETHFINKIDIELNGNEIITHKIGKQDNGGSQFATYMIPDAKVGDTIVVDVYCNMSGKLKKQIKVTK